MLILYQKTGKIPKIYENDETLPKKWKSYHKIKIIPVNFRQLPPIFRRPQRQNESLGRILKKTIILDLNPGSIHKKSRACSPNGSGDMTISAGNNFYTIKLRSNHNKEQFDRQIKISSWTVFTWSPGCPTSAILPAYITLVVSPLWTSPTWSPRSH